MSKTRNEILDGAISVYESGAGLASTILAHKGRPQCGVCALGALIVGTGEITCDELAYQVESFGSSEPFYKKCEIPETGELTPLQQAVRATAKVVDPENKASGLFSSPMSVIYGFSDLQDDPQPIIEVFRKAKELPE